jgi:hypothetical protein
VLFYAESHFPSLRAAGGRRLPRQATVAFRNDRICPFGDIRSTVEQQQKLDIQGPSVPGYDRHRRTDGLRFKIMRSRAKPLTALYHPFEIQ